jgi:hypothetical protein
LLQTRAVYFVTIKRAGYALFCMTPSERIAIGLSDDQRRVHVLARTPAGWEVRHDFAVEEHSHTDLMTRLGPVDEPATIEELVRLALGF